MLVSRLQRPIKCRAKDAPVWTCPLGGGVLFSVFVASPDDEDACCCFDDVVGDGFELVDLEDAGDLREKSFKEPEVASGDAFYSGD